MVIHLEEKIMTFVKNEFKRIFTPCIKSLSIIIFHFQIHNFTHSQFAHPANLFHMILIRLNICVSIHDMSTYSVNNFLSTIAERHAMKKSSLSCNIFCVFTMGKFPQRTCFIASISVLMISTQIKIRFQKTSKRKRKDKLGGD